MHRLRSPLVLVAVALLVVVAACGSDDDGDTSSGDSGPTTTTPAPADGGGDSGGEAGTIVAKDFELSDVTVAPGAEIILENQDGAPHTATADDDDAFDTGEVAGGDTSEPVAAPEEPGEYPFHCNIHTNMKATLTVEG